MHAQGNGSKPSGSLVECAGKVLPPPPPHPPRRLPSSV